MFSLIKSETCDKISIYFRLKTLLKQEYQTIFSGQYGTVPKKSQQLKIYLTIK